MASQLTQSELSMISAKIDDLQSQISFQEIGKSLCENLSQLGKHMKVNLPQVSENNRIISSQIHSLQESLQSLKQQHDDIQEKTKSRAFPLRMYDDQLPSSNHNLQDIKAVLPSTNVSLRLRLQILLDESHSRGFSHEQAKSALCVVLSERELEHLLLLPSANSLKDTLISLLTAFEPENSFESSLESKLQTFERQPG